MELIELIVMGCLAVACIAVCGMVLFGVLWLNARDDLQELQVELDELMGRNRAHMVAGRAPR